MIQQVSRVLELTKMFFNWSRLVIIALAVVCCVAESDENAAKLLLYKSTSNDAVVEGRDFHITYKVINVGNAAATGIEIVDRYDATSFQSKSNVDEEGNVQFQLEELAPGAQSTFNVTVQPNLYGVYESTRARIKYGSGAVEMEGVDPDVRSGSSTSLGRIRIESAAEYERRTSLHLREYGLFALVFGIPTLIPYFLWSVTRSISQRISRPKSA